VSNLTLFLFFNEILSFFMYIVIKIYKVCRRCNNYNA